MFIKIIWCKFGEIWLLRKFEFLHSFTDFSSDSGGKTEKRGKGGGVTEGHRKATYQG